MIHPTADISKDAHIADNVRIGPFCSVAANVTLESGVILEPHVKLEGEVHIGKDTHLYAFVHIGNGRTPITIEEACTVREFTEIGTLPESDQPILISTHTYIMGYSDIRSGVTIGSHCTITNNVLLDQGSICQERVIVGAKASIASQSTIGMGSMIGGASAVQGDIPPYCLVEGYPIAEIRGLNLVGMRRNFEDRQSISQVKKVFVSLKRSAFSASEAEKLLSEIEDTHARQFATFVATHQVQYTGAK